MPTDTLALVGAAGGAGTTRLTLECATLLARDGRDVAVLDAAYATQGLADHTPGRIDPDMTALCLEDHPLETGLVDRTLEGAGRLAVCPARAPFERLARAKMPAAAETFADHVESAARAFDHVLVDVPPVAANQAVAAATATDAAVLVGDAARAAAVLPRARDRLLDLDVEPTTSAADCTLPPAPNNRTTHNPHIANHYIYTPLSIQTTPPHHLHHQLHTIHSPNPPQQQLCLRV